VLSLHHPIVSVYCCSFILRAHGHLAATTTPSISDSSQEGGHPCCAHSPEGLQGGGSTAGRAARTIDPRKPPSFLAVHCGDAARLAGRCGRSVYRVIVGIGRWAWGSRGEGTEGACVVGGEGGLRIDEKEQEDELDRYGATLYCDSESVGWFRTRVSLALFFLRRYGRGVRSPVRVFSSPPRSRCIHVHTVAFLMEHRPTNFTAQRNGELSIMLSSGLTATHHKNTNRHRLVPRSVTYNSRPIRFSDFCYSWSINVSPEANH